jgi:hypothetical protein
VAEAVTEAVPVHVEGTEAPAIAVSPKIQLAAAQNTSDYCEVNSEQWMNGCSVGCTAGWEGGDCPNSCTASPPPGYVLVGHRVHNISENNGSHSISIIPADSSYDYKLSVENAYKAAIDAAAKAGDKSAEASLKEEYENSRKFAESMSSSHQMARLTVSASKHGSFLDRKRGWSHHAVEINVKCVVPSNLQEALYKKYALK